MEFGGNDDGHLRGDEALWALIVKVEEVVETENAAKIAAETVEEVDLPFMSSTTPGLIRRGIDGQERITWDGSRRKGASNLHCDFLFQWECVYSSIVFS